MFQILLLLFIAVPVIEIALFIQVGGILGLWPTIAIILITAIVGASLVRQQGLQTLLSMQQKVQQGQLPAKEMVDGIMLAVAGVLLLTPGFMTDALGFALLFEPSRQKIAQFFMQRVNVQSSASFTTFEQDDDYQPFQQQHRGGHTFDGEYEEKKKGDGSDQLNKK